MMKLRSSSLVAAALLLGSCASTRATTLAFGEADAPAASVSGSEQPAFDPIDQPHELSLTDALQAPGMADRRYGTPTQRRAKERWVPGQVAMQGFLGAYELDTIQRSGGDSPPVDGSDESLSRLPAIGGGGQWKLAGRGIDLGLEAMISFGWRANAAAFAVGGGGEVVAVDVDLFLFDLYGGPFLNVFLGERWRAFGAVGPMLSWASFDQDGEDVSGSGSGFGTGWYTRAGLEFAVRPGLMIGGGVRWSDSVIDLDSGLGDLDVDGLQWAFTVTTGL